MFRKLLAGTFYLFLFLALISCANELDLDNNLYYDSSIDTVEDYSEVTTLTLGGIGVSNEMRDFIASFNNETDQYNVEFICYIEEYGLENAHSMLNVHMIAGQGPDIVLGLVLIELEESMLLMDLNDFVDSDPDINCNDFIPQAFSAMESRDGRLVFITNGFNPIVYLARSSVIDLVGELTVENIQNWLNKSEEHFLFNRFFVRENLVYDLLMSENKMFIDWETGEVNINNEEFIKFLNIISKLPENNQSDRIEPEDLKYNRQLFFQDVLWNVNDWRDSRRPPYAWVDDLKPVGFPFGEKNQHQIMLWMNDAVAINAGTSYPQGAWSFVRRKLLSNTVFNETVIPLRQDLLDKEINNSVGNISNNTLSDEEKLEIHDVIMNSTIRLRRNNSLQAIISESLNEYLSGTISVEDAVRVMQSRISIFVSERG